uniref:RING-type domain-containing protein n=1 Tax=Periophthalmus magnuspinnatus TaxID=409849 RepID=A0A3B3ZNX6_9GOBI
MYQSNIISSTNSKPGSLDHYERDFSPEKFSCSVCSEVLKDPATIPCGHTFCAQCVTNEIKAVRDKAAAFVYAQPGDAACDMCPRKKRKAVSACMGCRISYCESHIWDHYNGKDAYKTHTLVKPGINLKDNVCPIHHQYVTKYCCTDNHMVCPTCATRQHEGKLKLRGAIDKTTRKQVFFIFHILSKSYRLPLYIFKL